MFLYYCLSWTKIGHIYTEVSMSANSKPDRFAAIAPLFKYGGTIYIVLVLRCTPNKEYWALPSGGVRAHEDPLSGARRETREEACINASMDDILQSVVCLTGPSAKSPEDYERYIYLSVHDGPPQFSGEIEDPEIKKYWSFPLSKLPNGLGPHDEGLKFSYVHWDYLNQVVKKNKDELHDLREIQELLECNSKTFD